MRLRRGPQVVPDQPASGGEARRKSQIPDAVTGVSQSSLLASISSYGVWSLGTSPPHPCVPRQGHPAQPQFCPGVCTQVMLALFPI